MEHFKEVADKMLQETTQEDYYKQKSIYDKNKDMNILYETDKGIKYLMVRSLCNKEFLYEILKENSISYGKKDNVNDLMVKTFTEIEITQIISYIYNRKEYISEEICEKMCSELSKLSMTTCSTHNDDFNGNLNKIIRNKDTWSLENLEKDIEGVKKQLDNYIKWQWFNQKCSDINENIIKKQINILPTLRPIAKIDFFCLIENCIFPFDLKTTIYPMNFGAGCMNVDELRNELKRLNLDTKGLKKDLIERLLNSPDYIKEFIDNKEKHIELLKWFYEEQNPRLFSNNYRYYVILLKKNNISESKKLKCKSSLISENISRYFKNIKLTDIIDITYNYKKDKSAAGEYNTKCIYTLITED